MVKDFAPVTPRCNSRLSSAAGARQLRQEVSVAERIQLAKSQKKTRGAVNLCRRGGSGTPPHLATELFKTMTGVDMVHVPYKTVAAALTDVIAGQIRSCLPSVRRVCRRCARARSAGSRCRRRSARRSFRSFRALPKPGCRASMCRLERGARARPPPEAGRRQSAGRNRKRGEDARRPAAARGLGFERVANTPDEFAKFVRSDIARWAKVIRDAHVKVD
jgi:hypothetical protein